jgi:hypothetical protein
MNLFDLDIEKVAKNLMLKADLYNCSLSEAWDKHIYEIIKEYVTFEEVRKHIDNKGFSL